MTDLSQFKHIWSGSEPGWIVVRHTEDMVHLVARFAGGATIHDLKALRAVQPKLAAAPASDLMALKGVDHFDLGEHESASAHKLKALCATHQVSTSETGHQLVTYGLFNTRTHVYCLIEDEDLCRAVAAEAIRHGVPVRESTV